MREGCSVGRGTAVFGVGISRAARSSIRRLVSTAELSESTRGCEKSVVDDRKSQLSSTTACYLLTSRNPLAERCLETEKS